MKRKFAALALSVLFIAGCAKVLPITASICEKEQKAHEFYIETIAPFRPASAQARELAFYNSVMLLCNALAPEPQIRAAAAQSEANRTSEIRAVQRSLQRK